jgi:hypothetical protein
MSYSRNRNHPMSYSTIEGMVRQSTNNKIMDTQLKNYHVLKHGESMGSFIGTLNQCVEAIRVLEASLDRYVEHSPYTIGRI